jgi:hypothetical protein
VRLSASVTFVRRWALIQGVTYLVLWDSSMDFRRVLCAVVLIGVVLTAVVRLEGA